MNDSNILENIAAYNEESLRDLTRSLELSRGKFSLIYVRCNYKFLQGQIIQLLRRQSSVKFEELVLDESATNLYAAIEDLWAERSPDALMVFSLELVADLDSLLELTNRFRDEFRRFPFPIVLWVTNLVLKKLIRQASDFHTYASSPISFSLPDRELTGLLSNKVGVAFAGDDDFQIDLNEIEAFQGDLQSRQSELDEESKAYLAFIVGWGYARKNQIDAAVDKYQECWEFWQESNKLECRGIVELNIALAYEQAGKKYWQQARDYFEKSIDSFELANCLNLVARHISKWGALLRKLEDWEFLKQVAEKALKLHKENKKMQQLAQDYSWLAEVALHQSNWQEARQLAEQALAVSDSNISHQEKGLYRFILARSQQHLDEVENAVSNLEKAASQLETARQQFLSEDDVKLYVEILKLLQKILFKRKEYLAAFERKLERCQIESQYELRAFVGAGRLQPLLIARDTAEKTLEEKNQMIREIVAASGRQRDVDRLIEMIKNNQSRLIVIYGQSGVGKSSILEAGLIPALQLDSFQGRRYLPILLRVYQDWEKKLLKALNRAGVAGEVSEYSSEKILETLRITEDQHRFIVLIFDQFEEMFFANKKDRSSLIKFYDFLGECLRFNNFLYTNVIISLRHDDYCHFLLELSKVVKLIRNEDYQKILYYLGNLKKEDAKAVISSLNQRLKIGLHADLVDELVEDLAKEFDYVRPIELQVVGMQLETEEIRTLDQYKQQGKEPKKTLVNKFLEDAVQDCGEENKRVAQLVLYFLTNQNTRPLKTASQLKEDLKKEAEKLNVHFEKEEKTLKLVLKVLEGSGLVSALPQMPENFYQLVHDYLALFIQENYQPSLLQLQWEQEKSRRVEQENQQLQQDRKKRRQVQKGLFLAAIVPLIIIVTFIWQVYQWARTEIKDSSIASAGKAQALVLNRPFDARLAALRAGRKILRVHHFPVTDRFSVVTDSLRQAVYKKQDDLFVEYQRLTENKSLVNGVSFSPDGELIASASADNTVKLWSREGKLLQTFTGHEDLLKGVSFSPDGKLIASASADKTVKLWSRDGKLLQTFTGHKGWVNGVSFSPDGKLIASASADNTVKLWSRDGKLLQTFAGHKNWVRNVSFSRDEKLIASASDDSTVKLWSREGKELQTLRGHEGPVNGVSFSQDGKLIASASNDNTVKLWSREGKELQTLRGHEGSVNGVSFSPDGELIASASRDKTVKLWSREGKELQTLTGHQGPVYDASFSPDGKLIASASDDNTVKLWSRDGKELRVLREHQDWVNSVSFSPNGQLIASSSADNTVKLWSRDGKLLQTFTGHKNWVRNVSFSPDEKLIATASDDETVKLWSRNGKLLQTLTGHQGPVYDASFSPDGNLIASGGADKTVKLWSRDGKLLQTLTEHNGFVLGVNFSPDGNLIASASSDNTVKLWSRNGKLLETLAKHESWVYDASFSPDGKLIATASDDGTVKLWSRDGKLLQTLRGHKAVVYGVSFSWDGELIASASLDNTVKLWSPDGKLLQTLEEHKGSVNGVSFSPNGKLIASASADGTVILWDVWDFNELMKLNCQLVGDYLRNNPNVEESDRGLCDGFDVGE